MLKLEEEDFEARSSPNWILHVNHVETVTEIPTLMCFSRLGSWYFSPLDEGRWKLGRGFDNLWLIHDKFYGDGSQQLWALRFRPSDTKIYTRRCCNVSILWYCLRWFLHIFCTCSNLKLSTVKLLSSFGSHPQLDHAKYRFSSCKEQGWISQLQIEWFSWNFSCILGRCSVVSFFLFLR